MDPNVKAVILECAKASAEGRIMFGDVVKNLTGVGVERYHVDFMRGDASYSRMANMQLPRCPCMAGPQ